MDNIRVPCTKRIREFQRALGIKVGLKDLPHLDGIDGTVVIVASGGALVRASEAVRSSAR